MMEVDDAGSEINNVICGDPDMEEPAATGRKGSADTLGATGGATQ
jgi:hypothetical protein